MQKADTWHITSMIFTGPVAARLDFAINKGKWAQLQYWVSGEIKLEESNFSTLI